MKTWYNVENVTPLAFKFNGKVYGFSNRQFKGPYTVYCEISNKTDEKIIYQNDFSKVEPITDEKEFAKIHPHLSKKAKAMSKNEEIFESTLGFLVTLGYKKINKPFPYSKESREIISKEWSCNWDTCESALQKVVVFFEYYYVFEVKKIDDSFYLTETRYNRKLFQTAIIESE